MQEEIEFKCQTCGASYKKPAIYQVWNETHPNVFFKWSLTYCDPCRREKEGAALGNLSQILEALSETK